MSRHDPWVSLLQMRDFANEAIRAKASISRRTLDDEFIIRQGVIKTIENIGEAASRLPRHFHGQHPEIDWDAIIGMRHRLVHAYDNIDLDAVWDVLCDDLPILVSDINQLLERHGGSR